MPTASSLIFRRFEDRDAEQAARLFQQLKLLIVSPEARGMGMGKRLIQAVADHVREIGRDGFFLLTDDACDVGFYEHLGLCRQLEEPSRAEPGLNLYVYSKELG